MNNAEMYYFMLKAKFNSDSLYDFTKMEIKDRATFVKHWGYSAEEVIIESEEGHRFLLSQGYGYIKDKGAVRWVHGNVYFLGDIKRFKSLGIMDIKINKRVMVDFFEFDPCGVKNELRRGFLECFERYCIKEVV